LKEEETKKTIVNVNTQMRIARNHISIFLERVSYSRVGPNLFNVFRSIKNNVILKLSAFHPACE
jgi:hypothetical protein